MLRRSEEMRDYARKRTTVITYEYMHTCIYIVWPLYANVYIYMPVHCIPRFSTHVSTYVMCGCYIYMYNTYACMPRLSLLRGWPLHWAHHNCHHNCNCHYNCNCFSNKTPPPVYHWRYYETSTKPDTGSPNLNFLPFTWWWVKQGACQKRIAEEL